MDPKASGTLYVKLLTPTGTLFEGPADLVRLPGALAPFTVLPGHCAILSSLAPGKIEVEGEAGPQAFAISGGFAQVAHDRLTLCVEVPHS